MGRSTFVNRTTEMDALRRWWDRGDLFGLVWGRRRVGKSWLLAQFAEGLRVVSHVGGDRALADELRLFSAAVGQAGLAGHRDLDERAFASWDEALDSLVAASATADRPTLLVLDEFPDLLKSDPSLESTLRAFGERAPHPSPLRILLCGSAVRVMERVQEERSPLFGRFGLNLQVHPFRPHEAALMLPNLTPAQRALVWGIVGGTPLYLSWWDQDASVEENLSELVTRPGGRLLTEGRLVLATDADTTAAGPVLSAIAGGRTKFNEIKDAVRTDPTRTLERLIDLRLIERVAPVTDQSGQGRRTCYCIADNLLAFWLGVLDRYRSEISRGMGEAILPVLMASLSDHMGPRWEEALRWHLRRLAVSGAIGSEVVAVGSFWHGGGNEIDAVALRGRSREAVLVAEAKWAERVDAGPLETMLQRKVAALPRVADDMKLAVCARNEVVGASPSTLTITAADIFSA